MRIGVNVLTNEIPPATGNIFNTANAYMIGLGDTGSTTAYAQCQSINDVTNAIGPRSSTNSVLWDSADVYFREGGGTLYISRIVGGSNATATLTLQDANSKPSVVITAKYPGVAANNYTATVAVTANTTFTANTATSTALSAISSFANIAPGTLITGTGIPVGTFIVSVNTAAGTAVISQAATATASGVTMTPSTFTVTIGSTNLGTTETHGPYINTAALYADTSSQLVTFSQSGASQFTINNPAVLAATALTGGSNGSAATLTNAQTALAGFPLALGPGQVSAPGYTNTTLSGIWTALGAHAQANNRVAICDMDDLQTTATLVTAIGTFGTGSTGSYCAFWGGQTIVPGATNAPGITRTVPASPVISALCARVDRAGNPNQPAAGTPNGYDLELNYVSGFTGTNGAPLYAQADIDTLNAAGINTWNTIFGVQQNYGFVSSVLQSADSIYWQFNHARMRMALEALTQVTGQPFVFSQISLIDIAAFSADLAAEIAPFVKSGAISTINPVGGVDQGFTVDTGPSVNTPASMANCVLNADVSYRPAPFAQLVQVQLSAVPVTASLS